MSFFRRMTIALRLLFDNEVSISKKMWIIVPLLYLISPIDFIPDYPVLGLGLIDDIVLFTFFLNKINEIINNYIKKKEKKNKEKEIKGKIVEDVEYEIKDEEE